MVKLILVRHGETAWNKQGRFQGQSDVPLSEAGIKQAEQLAKFFPLEHLNAIYASDLKRAHLTALKVAERFSLPVHTEKAFREMNFGVWEGLTYEEIASRWQDAVENFFQRPDLLEVPQGESFAELQARAVKRVQEIVAAHEGASAHVAIFAHGAVIRALLAYFLHMPLRYLWSIRQYNTAVNIVRIDDGHPTIELVNSTAHSTLVKTNLV